MGVYAQSLLDLPAQNQSLTSADGVTCRVFYYGENEATVAKAALAVTADNGSKTYGERPTLTGFTPSDLQNGETIGSVTLTKRGNLTRAAAGYQALERPSGRR